MTLTSQADLRVRILVKFKDEISRMYNATNKGSSENGPAQEGEVNPEAKKSKNNNN